MTTSVDRQIILNVESDIEGIKIRLNVRDGLISQIGFKFTDPLRNVQAETLFPHDGTLASLKRFQLQLGDVIAKTEAAL